MQTRNMYNDSIHFLHLRSYWSLLTNLYFVAPMLLQWFRAKINHGICDCRSCYTWVLCAKKNIEEQKSEKFSFTCPYDVQVGIYRWIKRGMLLAYFSIQFSNQHVFFLFHFVCIGIGASKSRHIFWMKPCCDWFVLAMTSLHSYINLHDE